MSFIKIKRKILNEFRFGIETEFPRVSEMALNVLLLLFSPANVKQGLRIDGYNIRNADQF